MQCGGLIPVIGRQRHSPDVPWLIQFDAAAQRVLRIGIDQASFGTLVRASTDIFVINIGSSTDAGSLQVGNGASVLLTGGITPDRVILHLIGAETAAQLSNHTVFDGTILAVQGQFTCGDGDTPNPVLINSSLLFGGSIAIGNNTNLNFYPFGGVGGGEASSSAPTS
jgi:hypothetical protein